MGRIKREKQILRRNTLAKLRATLRKHYPTLSLLLENGKWLVRGRFPVYVEGVEIDNYLIEILIPEDFPHVIPLFREIGGRIPGEMDWHVTENGFCCPFVNDEQWKYWSHSSNMLDFLLGPANDYFCGQTYRMKHGKYPFGERSHGAQGIYEYYTEELETNDLEVILRFLAHLSHDSLRADVACYCGSRKPLRDCHIDIVRKFRWKIPRSVAQNSFNMLYQLYQLFMDDLTRRHRV